MADLGLPTGYISNRSAVATIEAEQDSLRNRNRELRWNDGLLRRNYNGPNVHENNLFENYFSASEAHRIEQLIAREQAELEEGLPGQRRENNTFGVPSHI